MHGMTAWKWLLLQQALVTCKHKAKTRAHLSSPSCCRPGGMGRQCLRDKACKFAQKADRWKHTRKGRSKQPSTPLHWFCLNVTLHSARHAAGPGTRCAAFKLCNDHNYTLPAAFMCAIPELKENARRKGCKQRQSPQKPYLEQALRRSAVRCSFTVFATRCASPSVEAIAVLKRLRNAAQFHWGSNSIAYNASNGINGVCPC